MTRLASLIAAAALAGAAAAPVAAQYQQQYPQPYPQPVPQPYQQPYQQPVPQPGYPYQDQNYGTQGTIGAIIDSLIGNRYNVSDRQAIRQCAFAAVQRAQNGYPQAYPGYNNYLRVTAITDVQRRSNGVRVHGMLGNGRVYNQPYDPRFPNGGGDRWGRGNLSFRCDVDYRGYVRNVRIQPAYRGY